MEAFEGGLALQDHPALDLPCQKRIGQGPPAYHPFVDGWEFSLEFFELTFACYVTIVDNGMSTTAQTLAKSVSVDFPLIHLGAEASMDDDLAERIRIEAGQEVEEFLVICIAESGLEREPYLKFGKDVVEEREYFFRVGQEA